MTDYEQIQAGRIQVGDHVARARTHTFRRVVRVDLTAAAVWLYYEDGTRDRPGQTARWWRVAR